MKQWQSTLALMSLGLLLVPLAHAAPSTEVQVEVSFLLGYVDGSRCDFKRNGSWHNAQAAQDHMRDKYRYLLARGLVDTTEQFIERAATQSSLSGQAYEIRCGTGPVISSKQWLTEELARLRSLP